MKTRLYVGLYREDKWFRHAEIKTIRGGSLSFLDGADKTGAARVYNVLLNTVTTLYDENDEAYEMQDLDYGDIKVVDTWKICREALKQMNNTDTFSFAEYFFCHVCSNIGAERYTSVTEDWDQLIEEGFIDEFFLEGDETPDFWTKLPLGISIQGTKNIRGGEFTKLKRTLLDIGDLLKIQKNQWATKSEANMICAVWDATIVEIEGMPERDFNVLVRRGHNESFCKNFLVNQEDINAMEEADEKVQVGMDARDRSVSCSYCREEIGGYLDFTNFFQSLLSKKSSQKGPKQQMGSV